MDPLHYGYGYDPPPDWRVGWERDMPMLAGRFVLTLPARISPRKGQDDFLALIAALRERGLPAHGLLAGGTDRPERLSALIGDMLWHLPHLRAIARAGTAGSATLLTKRRSQADRLLAAERAWARSCGWSATPAGRMGRMQHNCGVS